MLDMCAFGGRHGLLNKEEKRERGAGQGRPSECDLKGAAAGSLVTKKCDNFGLKLANFEPFFKI